MLFSRRRNQQQVATTDPQPPVHLPLNLTYCSKIYVRLLPVQLNGASLQNFTRVLSFKKLTQTFPRKTHLFFVSSRSFDQATRLNFAMKKETLMLSILLLFCDVGYISGFFESKNVSGETEDYNNDELFQELYYENADNETEYEKNDFGDDTIFSTLNSNVTSKNHIKISLVSKSDVEFDDDILTDESSDVNDVSNSDKFETINAAEENLSIFPSPDDNDDESEIPENMEVLTTTESQTIVYEEILNATEEKKEADYVQKNTSPWNLALDVLKSWFGSSESNDDKEEVIFFEDDILLDQKNDFTTITPLITDRDMDSVDEEEEALFFFPSNRTSSSQCLSYIEKIKELEENRNQLANNLYRSLDTNQSLSVVLNDLIHQRLIVETEKSLDIMVNGSCLLLLKRQVGTKPTFVASDHIQPLVTNELIEVEITSPSTLMIMCDGQNHPVDVSLKTSNQSVVKGNPVQTNYLDDGSGGQMEKCDERCYHHGICQQGGVCSCLPGWNGKFCSLSGCPHNCLNRGQCKQIQGLWKCICDTEYTGEDCSKSKEQECGDGVDNDLDGLIDCQDPDCCYRSECLNHHLCLTMDDPKDILRHNNASKSYVFTRSSGTSSFWERIRFLVMQDKGVQRYAQISHFDPKTVCVIRGKVVTSKMDPLIGVRVSHENHLEEGFTLTRPNGLFDFVCNCNSSISVRLKFGRSPFPFVEKSFYAFSNMITYVGNVVLSLDSSKSSSPSFQEKMHCERKCNHQECSLLKVETNAIENRLITSLEIPQTHLKLTFSGKTSVKQTTISLLNRTLTFYLTGARPHYSLWRVKINVMIEGKIFEDTLEAEANMKWNLRWNGLNAYGQKIIGQTIAIIEVGYQFTDCVNLIWDRKNIPIYGYQPESEDMFGWQLDFHHQLDSKAAILYLGNGQVIDLKTQTPMVQNVLEFEDDLPVAITSNGLNVIYVGTNSAVYEIDLQQGKKRKLFELKEVSQGVKFYMFYDDVKNELYISLPVEKVVVKLDPSKNPILIDQVAGTGEHCKGNNPCGDNGKAVDAELTYPKGLALDNHGNLYLADGRRIRQVSYDNKIITTIAGTYKINEWLPQDDCERSSEWSLHWPTALIIHPLDDLSIYFIDGGEVLKLQSDKIVRHSSCYGSKSALSNPKSMTFSFDDAELYVVAGHQENPNSGSIFSQDSFGNSRDFLKQPDLGWFSDITALRDGSLLACDPATKSIRKISRGQILSKNDHLIVPWHESNEAYIFSAFGAHHHLETRSLFSDTNLLRFVYDSKGLLVKITNKKQSYLQIDKRINGDHLLLNNWDVATLKANAQGLLSSVLTSEGWMRTMNYDSKGNLRQTVDNGKYAKDFNYDENGNFLYAVDYIGNVEQEVLTHERPSTSKDDIAYKIEYVPRRNEEEDYQRLLLPYQACNKTLSWDYFVRQKSRTFNGFSGLAKNFLFNHTTLLFSSEMHPFSGLQALYDAKGDMILKVEEYYVPPRRLWFPNNLNKIGFVDENYDFLRRLTSWKWGELSETYDYDSKGRMNQIVLGKFVALKFGYEFDESNFPTRINNYQLIHDRHGDLSKIITPLGFEHAFQTIPLIGSTLIQYYPPWSIDQKPLNFLSGGSGNNNTSNDKCSTTTVFKPDNFIIEYCDKNRFSVSFDGKSNVTSSSYYSLEKLCKRSQCQFELVAGENNNNGSTKKEILAIRWNHLNDLVTEMDEFTLSSRSGFSSLITAQDFIYLYEKDSNARLKLKTLIINGQVVHHQTFDYDWNNKLVKHTVKSQDNTLHRIYAYKNSSSYGILHKEDSNNLSIQYNHDLNGNIIGTNFGQISTNYAYEAGERISITGQGNQILYNKYGQLIKKMGYIFQYYSNGFLKSIINEDKNETMHHFMYKNNQLILHMKPNTNEILKYYYYMDNKIMATYSNDTGLFSKFYYDDNNHIFAMKTNQTNYYITTDLNGTPTSIFNTKTISVRNIRRTAFGLILEDSNPDFDLLPIGYFGGIEIPECGIVLLDNRPYDNHLGQWMTPKFDFVKNPPNLSDDLFQIHAYRFKNNDPFSQPNNYMDTFEDWLRLNLIKPPKDFLDGQHSIFTQIPIEHKYDFVKKTRKPQLFHRGFSSTPQLLGPNVVLKFDPITREIESKVLQGTGTVEKIIARLINRSLLMEVNLNQPQNLNFFVTEPFVLNDAEITILEKSAKAKRNAVQEEDTDDSKNGPFFLTVNASHFQITFWIGFNSIEEAETARNFMNL